MRDLGTKVLCIGHTLCLTTDDPYMEVFVEDLRSTEALSIGRTEVDILRGVEAQGSTGAEDSCLDGGVLIEASPDKEAPEIVLPLYLSELASIAYHLTERWGEGEWVGTKVEAILQRLLGLPLS